MSDGSFANCAITNIYVPSTAVNDYKAAYGWSDGYFDIISAITDANTIDLLVNFNAGGSVKDGVITLVSGAVLYMDEGDTKTVTVNPVEGYKISAITYNGEDVLNSLTNNQYTTPSITSNATLNIVFDKIEYKLSIESAQSGAVVMLCGYAATPSFEFTPSAGWKLNTVLYNNTDVTSELINGKYTVPPIDADAILNVSFVADLPTFATTVSDCNITVFNSNQGIVVSGVPQGERVELFDMRGTKLKTKIANGSNIVFSAQKGSIYIIKTQHKAFKVIF